MVAVVDDEKCVACGACVDGCPVEAITVEDVAKINPDICTSCGACVDTCPTEAISLND